ncbi:MAG: hypothetical protein P1U50_00985 [Parvibaculaceae bacterium]|nr:hypothetical protein [Parvibaculaceae bacterium]
MTNLQDTPQQALAGWLHQRGGEKAIEKMAEDLGLIERNFQILLDNGAGEEFPPDVDLSPGVRLSISICLYTDGEVIFPSCPAWAVEKVKGLSHG